MNSDDENVSDNMDVITTDTIIDSADESVAASDKGK